MKKYLPSKFEPKWQQKWQKDKLYRVDLSSPGNKYYLLVEFTYPSGDLHMGHWFTFAVPDILGRMKRMQGHNVFMPNGFDAFGLPAENAAIQHQIHPSDWTYDNIKRMKEQFATMGASYNWEYEVITCQPEYYKWNQWIFLKMYERGLAYKGKFLSNWCPSCQTVLANENVEFGRCWRCSAKVGQKEIEQWFLKITYYVDKLLWPEIPKVNWPKSLREGQNNWIGRSQGLVIKFDQLEVFTTRPDTLFGATFVVISPEYHLLSQLVVPEKRKEVEKYLAITKKRSQQERQEERKKTGVFTGSFVKNPINGQKVPVWVADYVLMEYGTGVIMAVPAHDQRDFEFAQKYGLEIKRVVEPTNTGPVSSQPHRASSHSLRLRTDGSRRFPSPASSESRAAYEGEGILVNSGQFSGLDSATAREKISDYLEKDQLGRRQTNYHLHDWSISRQRYWGAPIPIIYCNRCGTVPVPEKDLPVELPYKVDYAPKGKPPLATAKEWVKVKCPKCAGGGRREVETMDTFVDSSWYFLRFLDPKNQREIFGKEVVKNWMPVDIYFGGSEHTYGHALYSRFFVKFLKDLRVVDFEEYAKKRFHHGVILGPDGARMSKSRGNVVNPDEQVKEYGADSVRIYLAFLGPYYIVTPWNPSGINGVYRFLQRVWGLFDKVTISDVGILTLSKTKREDFRIMHKTIKKVTEDISEIKFNTAIASLMEWLNHLSSKEKVSQEEYKTFLLLLAPFAPHISEELWQMLGRKYSIHQQPWPKYEEKYLEEAQIRLVIQVNGKVRDSLLIQKEIENNKKVIEEMALESSKVQRFLNGKNPKKVIHVKGKLINLVV